MKKRKFKIRRLILPFIGTGSLIWFLLRVIPKPCRASYPCMRVAAPMASSFVLWLLGLASSFLFLKRARYFIRQNRYVIGAVCIAGSGIAGAIFISQSFSPPQAAPKANVAIGVAQGANPGRVVWVYDSTATNWGGLGDGHWWEGDHTRQVVVDEMMSKTLRHLSGESTDSAAWDTLFRYYNRVHGRGATSYVPGEKIAIKINLTYCNFFPEYCCVDSMTYHLNKKLDYMSTSPQAVRALLRQLVNVVGVEQSDISVGDPVAYYPHEYYDSCHTEFPDVQYIDHAGKFGRTKVQFSNVPVYWSCRPTGVKQDYVPRHYAEATYIINLANMKSHMGAGITLCAKNHYGSLIRLPADSGYYDLHQSLAFMSPDMGSYRALVDIMGQEHLGGKTVLYLIDGLYAGNHNNDTVPHKWPVAPFNGRWTSSIFGSQDPVALESVLFDLFQLDDDPYQYPKIAGAEDYLIEAALANNPPSGTFYDPNHMTPTERLQSLGVAEHWNNPIDRKYSRNLGIGDGIELMFVRGAVNGVRQSRPPKMATSDYSLRVLPKKAMLEISMPAAGHVKLMLYNVQGRKIGALLDGSLSPGLHQVSLSNGIAENGSVASGFYLAGLYGIENGEARLIAKCTFELPGR